MSIRERLEEACILWNHGRKEGAWVNVLIAASATSRKRYPPPIKDNMAFKTFILDELPIIFTGKPWPQEQKANLIRPQFGTEKPMYFDEMLYKHFRCMLVHEAKLGEGAYLTESTTEDGYFKGKLIVEAEKVGIPEYMVFTLMKSITDASENCEELRDFKWNTA